MKFAFFDENLDDLPYKILEELLKDTYKNEFSHYAEFYNLTGEIEKNIFKLYLHPLNSKDKIHIATYDLEKKLIIESIDKDSLRNLLLKENEKLKDYQKKEIERSSKIIISIIGLILGLIVAFIVIKVINGGF
ncbi:hypothetical protein [Sulfurihydrogenibium subterraneum]|uniref:hypothetical protein n=1 Tax=Sulfurihydrogenibium subterraneum TaxID=171121 RepID=UPI00048AB6EC|nr:hypothetical protein [Sulfurihydrogenibium subterraneum]